MSIKVNIHRHLQHLIGGLQMTHVEGSNVAECLEDLIQQFPVLRQQIFDEKGTLLNYVYIGINIERRALLEMQLMPHSTKTAGSQRNVDKVEKTEELTKPVRDGDSLSIVLRVILGGG